MKDAPSYSATVAKPTSNNQTPPEGSKAIPVELLFDFPGQTRIIDMLMLTQNAKISMVQGVWVNTFNGIGIQIESEVLKQRADIPANSQGFLQTLTDGTPKFAVTADAAGIVRLVFVNFPVVHSLALQSGGIQSIVAGANITVDNTDPKNPIVSSTGGGGGGSPNGFNIQITDGSPVDISMLFDMSGFAPFFFAAGDFELGGDVSAYDGRIFYIQNASGGQITIDTSLIDGGIIVLDPNSMVLVACFQGGIPVLERTALQLSNIPTGVDTLYCLRNGNWYNFAFEFMPNFVGIPATAASPGTRGQMALTLVGPNHYLYVCVAANSWKRVELTTW